MNIKPMLILSLYLAKEAERKKALFTSIVGIN